MSPQQLSVNLRLSLAVKALDLVLSSFELSLEEGIRERSQHPEYTDATEVLVAISRDTEENLSEWITHYGPYLPPAILKKFRSAWINFVRAAVGSEKSEESALRGHDLFLEGVEDVYRHMLEIVKSAQGLPRYGTETAHGVD